MHALASSHLKRAGVFMSISVEVVGIHVFLVNSPVDMYAKCGGSMADALRMLNKMLLSRNFCDLDCCDVGKCEVWPRAVVGTRTICQNATGRCATKLFFTFVGGGC
jgi:hypothetical protein